MMLLQLLTKTKAEQQLQNVLSVFEIDPSLSRQEQLNSLRKIPHQELIDTLPLLRLNSFRAVTDQDFIDSDMMERLRDGSVAKGFRDRSMKIVIGETESEVCCP
jgi:carboxylesterase type B